MDYEGIITVDIGKRGGRPCIRGMRISVSDVLGWLASGMSNADIIDDYPELTRTDIQAALAYAANRENQIYSLEAELARLTALVNSHTSNTAKGKVAEAYIANLINAVPTVATAGHDLKHRTKNLLFEVKFSKLQVPYKGTPTRRWEWTHVFGSSGDKSYHRLILVGEADPRFFGAYHDVDPPISPYVLFDVPFENVAGVADHCKRISVCTNPTLLKRTEAQHLFTMYQISRADLKQRYHGV